jgi:hypothetical protein
MQQAGPVGVGLTEMRAQKGIVMNDDCFVAHKFRTLNENFWRTLEEGNVYFAPPGRLNDPYDCQIDLVKAFRLAKASDQPGPVRQADVDAWRHHAAGISQKAETCGIFSLCAGDIRGARESLMWAHYANNHAGVCLTYRIPNAFVIERLVGASPVTYGPERLLAALRALDLSHKVDFDRDIVPVVTSFLTTKAEQWSYEQEARLVSFVPGLLGFDRAWLHQVCFGLRTPDADRAAVVEAVHKWGYSNCGLAELVHSDGGLFEVESRAVEA